jgi:hypothetical protein
MRGILRQGKAESGDQARGLLWSGGMSPSHLPEQASRLEGPDYVALVIEWNEENEEDEEYEEGDDAVTLVSSPSPIPLIRRKLATVVGALSAIVLTTWGLRRLGMAS